MKKKKYYLMYLFGIISSIMLFVSNIMVAQTFAYDDINRLVKADFGNGYVINYEYDKLGNRTKRVVTAGCFAINTQTAYYQSFEYGLGDWTQMESDDENWTHESGQSLSTSTGPDSAKDKNTYLYTESSSPRYNKTMTLQSGCYTLQAGASYSLTMDYHLYGVNIGRLRVQMSINGGGYTDILDESGNQGNSWQQLVYDLSAHTGKTLRFRIIGTTGSSYRSDIAIDNFRIGNIRTTCPNNLVVSNTLNNVLNNLPGEEHLAVQTVTSDATLNDGAFHFGANTVEMTAGFEVKSGVLYLADNNGCATTPLDQEKEEIKKR